MSEAPMQDNSNKDHDQNQENAIAPEHQAIHSWSTETIVVNGQSMTVMFPSEDMDD